MKRLGLLLGIGVIGVSVLLMTVGRRPAHDPVVPVSPSHAATPGSQGGRLASPVDDPRQVVSPEASDESAERGTLAGIVVFADGVPTPDLALVATALGEDGHALEPRVESRAVTDAEGRFVFEDLPFGPVSIRHLLPNQGTRAGLGQPESTYSCPGENVAVRLPAMRIQVLVLTPGGSPASDVWVKGHFDPLAEGHARLGIAGRTDLEGRVQWFVEQSGTADFAAYADDHRARAELRDAEIVPGVSARVFRLFALPLDETAALRVRVMCRESTRPFFTTRPAAADAERGVSTGSFFVRLVDPETGIEVRTIRSEDAAADGFVYGLPSGRYEVRLARRLNEPASMFLEEDGLPAHEVDLIADARATVDFHVECGGRIAVTLTRGEGNGAADVRYEIFLLAENAKPLAFYEPADGRILVRLQVPVGRRVVSERVLPPGTYDLRVESPGHPARRITAEVFEGRTTDLLVRLGG